MSRVLGFRVGDLGLAVIGLGSFKAERGPDCPNLDACKGFAHKCVAIPVNPHNDFSLLL